MASCSICGKGVQFGHNVSHSNRKTNRIWKANIQKVRCVVDGEHKRINVCTRCLRSGKVERAVSSDQVAAVLAEIAAAEEAKKAAAAEAARLAAEEAAKAEVAVAEEAAKEVAEEAPVEA